MLHLKGSNNLSVLIEQIRMIKRRSRATFRDPGESTALWSADFLQASEGVWWRKGNRAPNTEPLAESCDSKPQFIS